MFRAQNDMPEPMTIIGPPGIERFIRHTLDDLRYHVNFKIEFVEWQSRAESLAWTWDGVRLTWAPLMHSTFCLGYRLEEPPRPGKFHTERASAIGVPQGPLYGRLQANQPVQLPSGRIVQPQEVLGPPRRGRVIAFATDTRPCPALEDLLNGVDLAFVEGMFTQEHESDAVEKEHMTAAEAAKTAATARVSRLVLVHISPRYTKNDEAVLEEQAKQFFPNTEVGRALASYTVPLPD
jgi:ribonuclease Z